MIVDGTVSSSIFVIRHLPSPFRFSPSARLTVTFDHVSKPCRFNKGTDVGDDVIPDVHGSPLERAYLHFPPVFPLRRGKRGRFRARNQATKRSFLGNNGRINAFRAPGTTRFLDIFLARFYQTSARYCSMHKLRNGGSWHASFAKTLCDNHGVWYVWLMSTWKKGRNLYVMYYYYSFFKR